MNKSACGIFTLHPWEAPAQLNAPDMMCADALQKQLSNIIKTDHITEFWLVMDQGFPCSVAEAILSLKASIPLRLTCLIPFEEQHNGWPEAERDRYFSIMQQCDQEYLLSHHFSVDSYQQSVQKLLEHCGLLFVIWNGQAGDACDAIRHAKRSKHAVTSLTVAELLA